MAWGQTRKTKKLLAEGKVTEGDDKRSWVRIEYTAKGHKKKVLNTQGTRGEIQDAINGLVRAGAWSIMVKTTRGKAWTYRTGTNVAED